MKKIIFNSVLLVIVLSFIVGCSGQFENSKEMVAAAKTKITVVSVDKFKEKMDKKEDYVLIDCRQEHEFYVGHIPGAVNIPRGLIEFKITKLYPDRNTNLITYCKNGGRSALTAETLGKLKYKNVKSLAGGWMAWVKASGAKKAAKISKFPKEVVALVSAAKKRITEIKLEEFKAMMKKKNNYVLIDCREASEFNEGNIPGSFNIPRGLLEFKITKKFPDRNTNIFLYCKSGGRAALAVDSLKTDLKYINVKSIAGGWIAWSKAAGAPTKEVMALVKSVKQRITEILLKDFKALIDKQEKFILIDCRQPNEFKAGHIPKAINIPRGLIEFKVTKFVADKKTNIILYCKSGGRSALTAKSLKNLGYNVKSLTGGFKAWSADPLNPVIIPVVKLKALSPEITKKAPVVTGGCGD